MCITQIDIKVIEKVNVLNIYSLNEMNSSSMLFFLYIVFAISLQCQ